MVTFPDGDDVIDFKESRMQDLEVETYAMRPCHGVTTAELMVQEMKARHKIVHDLFGGQGKGATRNSSTILRKVGMPPIDEAKVVPLFDISSSQVLFVATKYVLDFTYYKDRKGRTPKSVVLGDNIFWAPDSISQEPPANPLVLGGTKS